MAASNEESRTVMLEKTTFLQESEKIDEEGQEGPVVIQETFQKFTRIKNQFGREFLAEMFGSFILISFGCGSVAQAKFRSDTTILPINFGFSLGVLIAILVTGKVSGCHINPAVSFAMFLIGKMSFLRFVIYSIAQLIGAFVGAFVVFIVYLDALKVYKPGMYSLDAAGIFATYSNDHLSLTGAAIDQIFGTALLIILVLAVTDKKNVEMPHGTSAIVIALTILAIGVSFAHNCGYAINPTRDLGPRLFTFVAGWGSQVFSSGRYFFWVPIVCPMLGAIVGSFLYLLFISNHF